MRNRKFRRIIRSRNSRLQGYQISLIAFVITFGMSSLLFYIASLVRLLSGVAKNIIIGICFWNFFSLILTMCLWSKREEVSKITVPKMNKRSKKLARKIRKLFNDKQIIDVLRLSNTTRYGYEMPEIYTWINEGLTEGFIAIENIANCERAERVNFEQRISGILAGKYQKFAIVNSALTAGDSFIVFYFEDVLTSQRLLVKENIGSLKECTSENKHSIRLSKDLVWNTTITPHMSIIARTRAGKSVFAGRYLAKVMLRQGWIVEYNSAKNDCYVKEYNGKSSAVEIVEQAEYWCSVMDMRLNEINKSGKENYLEMENMPDIGVFFDELGNLNASLESLDKFDKSLKISSRWNNAINRLSATGGASGIHIIAVSQFATKEGFLPSLARVNCSDAVIMLGGAADSAEERKYLMSGFADMPKRSYKTGQGIARILGSGRKWEVPHFYETPWFDI